VAYPRPHTWPRRGDQGVQAALLMPSSATVQVLGDVQGRLTIAVQRAS